MTWDNSAALQALPLILEALRFTVLITFAGTAIAMILGLVLAILRRSRRLHPRQTAACQGSRVSGVGASPPARDSSSPGWNTSHLSNVRRPGLLTRHGPRLKMRPTSPE